MSCGTCGIDASTTLQADTGVPAGAPTTKQPRCPDCGAWTEAGTACNNPRCPSNRPGAATGRPGGSGGGSSAPDAYLATADGGQVPYSDLCVKRVVRGADVGYLRETPSAMRDCTYAVLFTDGSALAVTQEEATGALHSTWSWVGPDYDPPAEAPHEDYNALPYEVRKHVGDKASFGVPEGVEETGDYGEWDDVPLPGSRSLVTAVFDNGGESADRYTVIFDHGRFYLAMSGAPDYPLGFSQTGESAVPSPAIGKRIEFGDLPPDIQEHVIARWQDDDLFMALPYSTNCPPWAVNIYRDDYRSDRIEQEPSFYYRYCDGEEDWRFDIRDLAREVGAEVTEDEATHRAALQRWLAQAGESADYEMREWLEDHGETTGDMRN